MLGAKCVFYVKNAKNAIFDAYATQHIPYIDMAIWVSKDTSGPQECRTMRLNKFWIGLMAQNYKILTFTFFLCIFRNFLCIFKMLWAKWRSNPRNFCSCFWTQWDHRTYIYGRLYWFSSVLAFWATLIGDVRAGPGIEELVHEGLVNSSFLLNVQSTKGKI